MDHVRRCKEEECNNLVFVMFQAADIIGKPDKPLYRLQWLIKSSSADQANKQLEGTELTSMEIITDGMRSPPQRAVTQEAREQLTKILAAERLHAEERED